ncbi:MAG: hypothetical protein PHF37_02275 [Phycisphaerae bacterium]|nr:hypothetical protein [Phycisphaerae bacterium]
MRRKITITVLFLSIALTVGCDKKGGKTAENMRALGYFFLSYSNDHHEEYPAMTEWCDIVINAGIDKSLLQCQTATEGPCNFAINPNVDSTSSPDAVLLFETKPGWNQHGGQEIATTENHKGKGCYILFNDMHVEFIKTEDLPNLIWAVK